MRVGGLQYFCLNVSARFAHRFLLSAHSVSRISPLAQNCATRINVLQTVKEWDRELGVCYAHRE